MKVKSIEYSTTDIVTFSFGSLGLISIIVFDRLYFHTGLLTEGWPDFSISHLIRSAVIFISVYAIFKSLVGSNKLDLALYETHKFPIERFSILVVLSTSILIVYLFLFKPSFFSALTIEDNVIEWASALLIFSASILIAFSFVKKNYARKASKIIQISLITLSLIFFLIAMEEVSWFQRKFQINTPSGFESNSQNELNLHNFYTAFAENMYYFGVFLFLVILPFFRALFPYISKNNYLKTFIARPFIAVVGSISCAYNFDMWNGIFTQIAFFSSIIILSIFAIHSNSKNGKYLILFTIFIIITTQLLFLNNGANFTRLWEVTEFRELFIPLGLFIYTIDMLITLNHLYFDDKDET